MASKPTAASVVFKAVNKMSPGLGKAIKAMNKFKRNAHSIINSLRRPLDRIQNKMSSLFNVMPGTGLLGGAGLLYGAKEALDVRASIGAAETAIRFISRSQGAIDNGAQSLQFLRNVSKELALDYTQAADSYKGFSASMMSRDWSLKEQQRMFREMGVGLRVLGIDAEAQGRIFYALGEILGKNQFMSSEVKVQLGTHMPGVMQVLTKAVNMANQLENTGSKILSEGDVRDMMKEGKLSAEKYFPAFTKVMHDTFREGLPEALKEVNASMIWLKNSWDQVMYKIGDSIFRSGVMGHLTNVTDKIGDWLVLNKKLVNSSLKKGVNWIVDVGKFIMNNWNKIAIGLKIITALFVAMKVAMIGLNVALFVTNPFAVALVTAAGIASALWVAYENAGKLRKELSIDKDKELSWMDEISLWTSNLAEGIKDWGSVFGSLFTGEFKRAFDYFVSGSKRLTAGVGQMALTVIGWIYKILDALPIVDLTSQIEGLKAYSKSLDVWANPLIYNNVHHERTDPGEGFPSLERPSQKPVDVVVTLKNHTGATAEVVSGNNAKDVVLHNMRGGLYDIGAE